MDCLFPKERSSRDGYSDILPNTGVVTKVTTGKQVLVLVLAVIHRSHASRCIAVRNQCLCVLSFGLSKWCLMVY